MEVENVVYKAALSGIKHKTDTKKRNPKFLIFERDDEIFVFRKTVSEVLCHHDFRIDGKPDIFVSIKL